MIREVIFDVETKKFFDEVEKKDPALLGVSVVSLYTRDLDNDLNEQSGQMMSFFERGFENMWPVFSASDRIIGFNSLNFDVLALSPYFPGFLRLPHFDILDEIKRVTNHRVSLDAIAKETLGRGKTDCGANAVNYFAKGDSESLAKLKRYCEEDVAITCDVYDFARENGYLVFKDRWNNPRKVELDFSYAKKPQTQISLF
jgi:DEAD/DEAH box helicase domain-containing protein